MTIDREIIRQLIERKASFLRPEIVADLANDIARLFEPVKMPGAYPPPLKGKALEAARYMNAHPGSQAKQVRQAIGLKSDEDFRKRIMPLLRPHGYKNIRGADGTTGYYRVQAESV